MELAVCDEGVLDEGESPVLYLHVDAVRLIALEEEEEVGPVYDRDVAVMPQLDDLLLLSLEIDVPFRKGDRGNFFSNFRLHESIVDRQYTRVKSA